MAALWLTNATKQRVIQEIRKILYEHPKYRSEYENVKNKYSFKERPQRGVIVNATSADRVRLSADNYMGRLSSFCMLTWVKDKPCTTIEWVRENFNVLEQVSSKRDICPTAPGVYRISVVSLPDEPRSVPGQFMISPILTVSGEPLILFASAGDTEAQISRENLYPNSVSLWLDNKRKLIRNVDYTVDEVSGAVHFLKETPTNLAVHADYRYPLSDQGPYYFKKGEFNVDALPGIVIAFGDRCQDGDTQDIVITDERTDVAEVYGGKFEVSFSLIAFSKDSEDREKFSDYIIHKFLDLQNVLGNEGLELIDISPNGEDEEVYNAEEDSYYYDSSISLSIRTDWETWLPLPIVVTRTEMTSQQAEQQHGWLDNTAPVDLIKVATNADYVPVFLGKELFYERVS